MDLPVQPPVAPMLAKAVHTMPDDEGLAFEPKWDGFRCLVWRDGDEIELASRNGKPLTRYFPELIEPLRAELPNRCVVDGEVVIVADAGIDFDLMSARIHPAVSRVAMLAETTPASFVAFDLLAMGDRDLQAEPFVERRRLLVEALGDTRPPVHLTPHTTDGALAAEWFARFEGAGFDGVMAKDLAGTYQQGKRAQVKVKHRHTADCVVAGFRLHKDGAGVGSLLLGLWGPDSEIDGVARGADVLHHVGVATSFTAARRRELVDEVAPLTRGALDDHPWASWARPGDDGSRMPGAPSRWNAGKDMTWEAVRLERVLEVAFDGALHGRFRHATRFVRWRPDKLPHECTLEQLDVAPPPELTAMFGRGADQGSRRDDASDVSPS